MREAHNMRYFYDRLFYTSEEDRKNARKYPPDEEWRNKRILLHEKGEFDPLKYYIMDVGGCCKGITREDVEINDLSENIYERYSKKWITGAGYLNISKGGLGLQSLFSLYHYYSHYTTFPIFDRRKSLLYALECGDIVYEDLPLHFDVMRITHLTRLNVIRKYYDKMSLPFIPKQLNENSLYVVVYYTVGDEEMDSDKLLSIKKKSKKFIEEEIKTDFIRATDLLFQDVTTKTINIYGQMYY